MKNIESILSGLQDDTYFIDTHCHLDMKAYNEDLEQILQRAKHCHLSHIISIGIDIESSHLAVKLALMHPNIFATIGIHPHDVDNICPGDYKKLANLCSLNKANIVGYGEIGLDYVKQYSDPNQQRKHFSRQLDLAHELKLPIIVHNREADDDTLKILQKSKSLDHGGIMHCFSGDYTFAKKIIDLGMLISIPGIVTFKNAATLHEVAVKIPLDKMIIETDGPFLAPHPYRGKRNEPAYVIYTAAKIAQLRKTDIDTIARQTTANASQLFQLN